MVHSILAKRVSIKIYITRIPVSRAAEVEKFGIAYILSRGRQDIHTSAPVETIVAITGGK
jgi:hypothetical protein